jgi:hypothetical protein
MRSLQLQSVLTEFIEAAAARLQADIDAGAEVPFELEQRGRRASPGGPALYCYQPLTAHFIAERMAALAALPGYREAAGLMERFEGLERYLGAAEDGAGREQRRHDPGAALERLLCEVFAEQTDFQLQAERVRCALDRLERAAATGGGESMLVAPLYGMTIASQELALTGGLTVAQPHALDGLPAALTASGCDLVVALTLEQERPHESLQRGMELLRELLCALRLFGDGRVRFGGLAWAQIDGGSWSPLALGRGRRPQGMLVVTAEQEDELRAFCNLVARRSPHGDELAWALRRYELGCEREHAGEALTDHLLALRALLEPEGAAAGLMPGRVAALCATPERRLALTQRVLAAIALERELIAGTAPEDGSAEDFAEEVAGHLRSLVRDVICGHLTPDLVGLADELLLDRVQEDSPEDASELQAQQQPADGDDAWDLEEAFAEGLVQALAPPPLPRAPLVRDRRSKRPVAAAPADATEADEHSPEQVLGDASEGSEVLDLLI